MNCPVCGGEMAKERKQDVEIDVCREHGIWLDKGELSRILINSTKAFVATAGPAQQRKKGRYEGIFLGWFSLFLPN